MELTDDQIKAQTHAPIVLEGHRRLVSETARIVRASVAKEIFEEIRKHRWQGHPPAVGFKSPQGYLITEEELTKLESKYEVKGDSKFDNRCPEA